MRGVFLDSGTLGPEIDLTGLKQLPVYWQWFEFTDSADTLARCQEAEIIITNKVVIDQTIMENCPNLKLICVAATGMNNIDLTAAEQKQIVVKNVTNYAGNSVAQVVFASVLQLFTHTLAYNNLVQQGAWSESKSFCLFDFPIDELTGKTLGLVGYGTLAKTVEKIARAFDMKVLISERPDATETRAGRIDFDQVLAQSDVLSLHCPLTATTKNLIAKEQFKQMKSTAIIVNTARGGIVNEADLVTALMTKEIAGAVVDVITVEPPAADYPLLQHQLPNLIITPHIAWASKQARQRLTDQLVSNIKTFLN